MPALVISDKVDQPSTTAAKPGSQNASRAPGAPDSAPLAHGSANITEESAGRSSPVPPIAPDCKGPREIASTCQFGVFYARAWPRACRCDLVARLLRRGWRLNLFAGLAVLPDRFGRHEDLLGEFVWNQHRAVRYLVAIVHIVKGGKAAGKPLTFCPPMNLAEAIDIQVDLT